MSREFCDHIIDLLMPWGPVTAKRMFGGFGLYRHAPHEAPQIFAIIAWETLYLKADDQTAADFEAAGCEPFIYEAKGKPVRLSYYTTPSAAFDDPDLLAEWTQKAYEAGRRAPIKKSAKKTQKKKA